jgi:methanol metabolism-related c-type cytochrome
MVRLCAAVLALALTNTVSFAASPEDSKAVRNEDGKYYDKNDNPTYNVQPDGTVDWFTYSGFRQYHSECHVCHGPDALGSTYAPALHDTLQRMDYAQFMEVVVNGRQQVSAAKQSVMPGFGTNKNVMCHLDDIYTYLRARADDAIPRGRPQKKEAKSEAARKSVEDCMAD